MKSKLLQNITIYFEYGPDSMYSVLEVVGCSQKKGMVTSSSYVLNQVKVCVIMLTIQNSVVRSTTVIFDSLAFICRTPSNNFQLRSNKFLVPI